jgi:hypothetical protein
MSSTGNSKKIVKKDKKEFPTWAIVIIGVLGGCVLIGIVVASIWYFTRRIYNVDVEEGYEHISPAPNDNNAPELTKELIDKMKLEFWGSKNAKVWYKTHSNQQVLAVGIPRNGNHMCYILMPGTTKWRMTDAQCNIPKDAQTIDLNY